MGSKQEPTQSEKEVRAVANTTVPKRPQKKQKKKRAKKRSAPDAGQANPIPPPAKKDLPAGKVNKPEIPGEQLSQEDLKKLRDQVDSLARQETAKIARLQYTEEAELAEEIAQRLANERISVADAHTKMLTPRSRNREFDTAGDELVKLDRIPTNDNETIKKIEDRINSSRDTIQNKYQQKVDDVLLPNYEKNPSAKNRGKLLYAVYFLKKLGGDTTRAQEALDRLEGQYSLPPQPSKRAPTDGTEDPGTSNPGTSKRGKG